MKRALNPTGGRQVKNEDLQLYIQAFDILESFFAELNQNDFILYGCNIAANGANFDISSGVILIDNELTLFDGVTNVSLPYRVNKVSVGVDPRVFNDATTKNTSERVVAQQDDLGAFSIDQNTTRATDHFLRFTTNGLLGNINANNNNTPNVYKPNLAARFENTRYIPASPNTNRYWHVGSFEIRGNQNFTFLVSGGGINQANFSILSIDRNDGNTGALAVKYNFISALDRVPSQRIGFFISRNDAGGVFEIWMQSPLSTLASSLVGTTIQLIGENSEGINVFEFNNSASWITEAQTPSLDDPFIERSMVFDDVTDHIFSAQAAVVVTAQSVRRSNRVVAATVRFTRQPTSNTVSLFIVPAVIRPLSDLEVFITDIDNGNVYVGTLLTSGELQAALPTGNQFSLHTSYIL